MIAENWEIYSAQNMTLENLFTGFCFVLILFRFLTLQPILCRFNPYKPSLLFMGHRQTLTPQNVASNQVLHCLLTEGAFKI